jgi:hypothetical protein
MVGGPGKTTKHNTGNLKLFIVYITNKIFRIFLLFVDQCKVFESMF